MIRTGKPNHSEPNGEPGGVEEGMAGNAYRVRIGSIDRESRVDTVHDTHLRIGSMTTDNVRTARILIVARPATSRAISSTLALAGYEVHRTPDANSAVEVAQRLRPQLAIVAADVPGSSGGSVARLLRSSQEDLPIIVIGIAGEQPITREVVWVPADLTPATLLATVADQLGDHPPSREAHVR